MELNLENPIFLVYMNVDGMSHQKTRESIELVRSHFSFENATTWIMPVKSETKVELIWQGSKYSTNPGIMNFNNFENLINRFNEVIEVISNGTDCASIKQQLRNLQLKKIFDDDTSI
jgi:hypothetical protein